MLRCPSPSFFWFPPYLSPTTIGRDMKMTVSSTSFFVFFRGPLPQERSDTSTPLTEEAPVLLLHCYILGEFLGIFCYLYIYIYNIQYLKTSWTSEKKNRWKKNTSQQACTENPRSKENPPNHGSPKNQSTVTATEPACPSTGRRKSAGPNLKWVLNPKIGGCFPQNGWWK